MLRVPLFTLRKMLSFCARNLLFSDGKYASGDHVLIRPSALEGALHRALGGEHRKKFSHVSTVAADVWFVSYADPRLNDIEFVKTTAFSFHFFCELNFTLLARRSRPEGFKQLAAAQGFYSRRRTPRASKQAAS